MIEAKNLSIAYKKSKREVIKDLSFKVKPNEFVSVLGPSGCGKTTLLNAIMGFVALNKGEIKVNGRGIDRNSRDVSIVFQDHVLFPWKTISGNIEFGPRMKGISGEERFKLTKKWLKTVGLEGFENHYPEELSGGMKQRVGIARALANNPKILLMDEPFGSLDAQTRMLMQEFLIFLWEKDQKTVIFVTHDIDEAILLSDRILLLTTPPGKLKKEIIVKLPRPRTQKAITSPEFTKLKRKIMALLREEIESPQS